MNNNTILITIITVFLIVGTALPYIYQGFGESSTEYSTGDLVDDIGQEEVNTYNPITAFTIFSSVASMFFWTFGAIPIWLNLIFEVFRVMLYVIIYDKARGIN